jgi:transcriptional regulator GlxA family with amidase domain
MALYDFMNNVYEMDYAVANPRVGLARKYLARRFRDPVKLEDVARAVGVGTYLIVHLIEAHTVESCIRRVHLLLIKEAKILLVETTGDCVEIAVALGFCDQSYSTRYSRTVSGVTLGRFRRMSRGRMEAQDGSQTTVCSIQKRLDEAANLRIFCDRNMN